MVRDLFRLAELELKLLSAGLGRMEVGPWQFCFGSPTNRQYNASAVFESNTWNISIIYICLIHLQGIEWFGVSTMHSFESVKYMHDKLELLNERVFI